MRAKRASVRARLSARVVATTLVALLATGCETFSPAPGSNRSLEPDRGGIRLSPPPAGDNSKRPNILVIMTDDQRAQGTLGVMSSTRGWFQREGVSFPNAFATTPLCCPARATVLSGRYAHNHRLWRNFGADEDTLDRPLQRRLQDAGYLTGLAGKLFNNWPSAQDPPYFDRWALSLGPLGGEYGNVDFNINGRRRTIAGYSTDAIGSFAVDILRAFEDRDVRPWFLLVTPFAPHLPATPEDAYRDALVPSWDRPRDYRNDAGKPPRRVRNRRPRGPGEEELRQAQLRTLMSVDDLVDRLFEELGDLGERSNTLAVYLSDHGMLWGEYGVTDKRLPYTGSLQIPLMFRWPDRIPEGTIDRRVVGNVDLAPTLLDAAGASYGPAAFDGHSLFDAGFDRHGLLAEYIRPYWASIRTRDYQYVEWYSSRGSTAAFHEFYDVRSDPFELRNLLADGDPSNDPDPRLLATLRRWISQYRACRGSTCHQIPPRLIELEEDPD